MSGRSRTSAISSTSSSMPGWRSDGEAGRAARAPAPARAAAAAARSRCAPGCAWARRRAGARARALRRHVRLRRARARADAGEFGQALLHQVAEGAVGNLREQRLGALGQPRLAVEARRFTSLPMLRRRRTPTAASPRCRRASKPSRLPCARCESGSSPSGRNRKNAWRPSFMRGSTDSTRLPRGAAAGAVAVEAEEHVGGVAEQQLGVVRRGRGAERGHRLRHAVLRQRDHVHVALDHDQPRELAVCACRTCHRPYSSRPLWNSGVSGELRYFGPSSSGSSTRPPKAIDAAAAVEDREHHPVAELVVDVAACRSSRTGRRARAAACGAGRCRARRAAR